jgi:hypothetical protein
MKRMKFDIFKRHTKNDRLEKLIENNKIKIEETQKTKIFNRLIDDANRRIEANYKIQEFNINFNSNPNANAKKINEKDWNDIYKTR